MFYSQLDEYEGALDSVPYYVKTIKWKLSEYYDDFFFELLLIEKTDQTELEVCFFLEKITPAKREKIPVIGGFGAAELKLTNAVDLLKIQVLCEKLQYVTDTNKFQHVHQCHTCWALDTCEDECCEIEVKLGYENKDEFWGKPTTDHPKCKAEVYFTRKLLTATSIGVYFNTCSLVKEDCKFKVTVPPSVYYFTDVDEAIHFFLKNSGSK